MKFNTRYLTIGGTCLCVLGIGYFMQYGSGPGDAVSSEPAVVARADFKPLSEPIALPDAPDGEPQTTASAPIVPAEEFPAPGQSVSITPEQPVELAALDDESAVLSEPARPDPLPAREAAGSDMDEMSCEIGAQASVEAGAMVRFSVDAPCLPNERVVVHHSGMMFTDATDENGALTALIPALAETGIFIVEFPNGEGAVATAEVNSLIFYDRIVLQWSGVTGLQLHAREYGAEYGETGHVWAGAARDVSAAALGQGGFVTLLGKDDGPGSRLAEVYTFPTGTAGQEGDIDMSVEVEITEDTCDAEIEGQVIRVATDGEMSTQYLSMTLPDCSATGTFLMLNNLVDDLKIAAR